MSCSCGPFETCPTCSPPPDPVAALAEALCREGHPLDPRPTFPCDFHARRAAESARHLTAAGWSLSHDSDREALVLMEFAEAVARQWGYVSGGTIGTGGLSTLEEAFAILGWDDPHPLVTGDPAMCDEPGCGAASSEGWPSPDGYRRTCHEHSDWHTQRRCKWPDDSAHWLASPATEEAPR